MSGFTSTGPGEEIAVIGIGNEYRGDDGVGIFIVRQLKAKNPPKTRIELNSREGISLMDSWSDSDTTILVDAVKSGAFPGKIYRLHMHTPIHLNGVLASSTHSLGIAEAIQLASTLKSLPRCLIFYGIEGQCFEPGRGLSPKVKAAAEKVLEKVMWDINQRTEDA